MILSRAPLRIPLGGGGTDLPSYYMRFGGFVLSAAVNKYVYIYLNRPAADDLLRVKYSRYEQVASVDEIQHDLVKPALKLVKVESGLEIVSMADVPDGTGLGSSASYLVALLCALYGFKRETISVQAMAELAIHIEMNLAGHPVGKQDHYLAAFGGLTCLDIKPDGTVHVSMLNISHDDAEELRRNTLLFFTGIRRSSREILQQQKDDTERARRAVIDSLDRTKELGFKIREALERGDLDKFGQLLDEHWQAKKLRSDTISDSRIDRWYELACEHGALGGKVVGAGGGGFLMLYCPASARNAVRRTLLAEGLREMAFDYDFEGAKILVNF